MLRTRVADFLGDRRVLRDIRRAVFVDEQQVPEEVEMDDRDAECVHVLAFDADGAPVGTVRIDLGLGGKVGRLAVLAAHRRSGVGTALMSVAHAVARDHALGAVWCEAQVGAVPFYERLGYRAEGATFKQVGIEHVRMRRGL